MHHPDQVHSTSSSNAMCESFFATLECELIDRQSLPTQAVARSAVFEFIEGWYNPSRRHSSLENLSPMNYERRHHLAARPSSKRLWHTAAQSQQQTPGRMAP